MTLPQRTQTVSAATFGLQASLSKPLGVEAGLDDVAAVREAVHDGGAESQNRSESESSTIT